MAGAGRNSEQVALRHPVMPVANHLGSGFVGINGGQLGKRDGHLTPLPTDQHEHVGGAGEEYYPEQCELSAGVRKSETVTLRDPVMPVTDGFSG